MAKAKLLGMQRKYIPNNRADMHYRRKAFERNKSKIEAEERLLRKAKEDLEAEKFRTVIQRVENEQAGSGILVHGAMKYGCEKCGFTWWMFLEKGLEEFGEDHKPVPFTISCPLCGGFAHDISGIWKFPDGGYEELLAGESYFANVDGLDCGVPVTDAIKRKLSFLWRENKTEEEEKHERTDKPV